jgi:small subunit ribosomal protein S17e
MGRIKTRKIKAVTMDLMEEYGDSFSSNFDENKKKVSEFTGVESKKMRNVIAGYITRLNKAQTK